jgi:D-alanyl-lipoteichoic acid acyltransferase DltB (MBOAT superfamily)
LVQGPISRFDDLSKTLYQVHYFDKKTISYGLQRIMWGFFKKLVIADRMLVAVNTLIDDPNTYSGIYVFLGMLFYTFELYADFTGGIDITIGVAQVFGIKVSENFIRPYFSKNIKEFWNRWHITMGTWFTDYIFYPISVSHPMLKLSKYSRNHFGNIIGKRITVYLSCFVVWFATGIWHGASWNFIVWGLINCAVILISQELQPCYKWFHSKVNVGNTTAYQMFQIVRTTLLLSSIRLFDLYKDVPLTFKMFGTIFTNWNIGQVFQGSLLELGLSMTDYLILLIGFIMMLIVSLAQRNGSVREKIGSKPYAIRVTIWTTIFLMILLMGAYGVGYDASQFIYNQF